MRRIPPSQRREELIAAAIRVIARSGVAAATTRAIVTEAQMPLGAFHYIFENHDELMSAVVETVTDQERFVAETRSVDATSIEAALLSGVNGYIDLLAAEPERELALLELGLFARRQNADGQMRTQWESYFGTAAEVLQYAAELTRTRWTAPLPDLARLLVASLDGITMGWLADHDTAAARRTAAFVARALAAHAEGSDADGPATASGATRERHPDDD
ncbi:TetR/AcrR family transcriptional regulator [Microbacterium sp. cx-59]|uniref:TetR/AcrR family transcriptional regulator n=1 Tax=Microbacterium sp. cx-59 TaxID=2891207 RepID=UPI001E5F6457|nr:TetR family transcriptional regulator [Microbacterium sp. cx-59]MCC4907513.1 TetR family transcriptional regulator [Microbacterium sp. cx-59]